MATTPVQLKDIAVTAADPRIAVDQTRDPTAAAITALGESAGQFISGMQRGRTEASINAATDAFQVASDLYSQGYEFSPTTGEVVGVPEGVDVAEAMLSEDIQRVTTNADNMFSRIKAGMAQGVISGGNAYQAGAAMANIQIENAVRNLAAQTPGFEDVIRESARRVLGYDPTGFGIRQILDVQIANTTPSKPTKYVEEANAQADLIMLGAQQTGAPITREQAMRMATNRVYSGIQRQGIEDMAKTGQLGLGEVASNYIATLENPVQSILGQISSKLLQSGGGVTFADLPSAQRRLELQAAATSGREQDYNNTLKLARESSDAAGIPLTPETIQGIRELVDARWQAVPDLIEQFSAEKLTEDNLKQLSQLAELNMWDQFPTLMQMKAGLGDQLTTAVYQAVVTAGQAGSGGQLDLLLLNDPVLRQFAKNSPGLTRTDMVSKALNNILHGANETITGDAPSDRKLEGAAMSDMLSRTRSSPQARRELVNLTATNKPDLLYSLFKTSPGLVINSMGPEAQAAVRRGFAIDTDNLSADLTSKLAGAMVPVLDSGRVDNVRSAMNYIDSFGFEVTYNSGKPSVNFVQGEFEGGIDFRVREGDSPAERLTQAIQFHSSRPSVATDTYSRNFSGILTNPSALAAASGGRVTNIDQFNALLRVQTKSRVLDQALASTDPESESYKILQSERERVNQEADRLLRTYNR